MTIRRAPDWPVHTRRDFLRFSTGGMLAAAGVLQVLSSACINMPVPGSPAASTVRAPGTPAASGAVTLPTYAPLPALKADLPGTDLVPDGYLAFPKTTFQSVTSTPGSGGDVTWMTYTFVPNAPMEDNAMWQAVNTQVGATLRMQLTAYADYQSRLSTVLAGGDLPDVVYIPGLQPELGQLLRTKFADLTPYLSGDAVKDYPNLGNLPTLAWKNTVFNNAIYAVPTAFVPFFWVLWSRQDMLDQVGAAPPATADDFKRVLGELLHAQTDTWGIASHVDNAFDVWNPSGGLYAAMFGAPNQWSEAGGKFTRTFETEQFKSAVGFARDLYAAGLYDPDSLTYNILSKRTKYASGRFAYDFDGMTIDMWNNAKKANPAAMLHQPVPPPGDGSHGHYWFGSGAFGFTAIRQAAPERIKEILRIMNYLAAPIGSEEYLLTNFGVKGVDFDFDANGNPTPTAKGQTDTMPWGGAAATVPRPPRPLFNPLDPEFARVIQNDDKMMAAVGVSDPSTGLYSATNADKGNELNQAMLDGITEIVKGTQPVASLDQLVQDWRTHGGDQIRAEMEQALAAT
ncbi:MAG: extracellular solute-binding protein [Chloroflexi bacterium]|nr:extracellular solute-binding protein [Chloroflexota bacterium]